MTIDPVALASDAGCDPATVRVALHYDRGTGDYVPQLVASHEYGSAGLGVMRRDLATNAALPAVARARRWAEELGVPCQE